MPDSQPAIIDHFEPINFRAPIGTDPFDNRWHDQIVWGVGRVTEIDGDGAAKTWEPAGAQMTLPLAQRYCALLNALGTRPAVQTNIVALGFDDAELAYARVMFEELAREETRAKFGQSASIHTRIAEALKRAVAV
jgi:hypothetical protein